jgi:S1-C subfamily serine protease
MAYEPTPQPELVGMPSYQDLKGAVYSFQNYLRGAELLAKFEEPVLTRGANGIAIYRRASPAVVLVFAGNIRGEQLTEWGMGTGVIVGPAGYVLTNWHVVKGFQGIVVLLKPPGSAAPTRSYAYDADLIDYYREKDLALLKLVNPPSNMTVIEIASASQLQVAQNIHVIGHPGGIAHAWSYTTGVVSQTRLNYETSFSGQEIHANVIQIQATVNPGNSGGPVLDDQGKMVGLISFGPTENMNFAIAADEISTFLSYAMRARTRGITAQAPDSPEAEYSVDLLLDGRRVIRASYPDMVVYFVHEDDVTGDFCTRWNEREST